MKLVQMRKPVKVEKTHSSHGTTQMIRPPPESSPSEDSDSSSTTSHVGPPKMTLSERYDLIINMLQNLKHQFNNTIHIFEKDKGLIITQNCSFFLDLVKWHNGVSIVGTWKICASQRMEKMR